MSQKMQPIANAFKDPHTHVTHLRPRPLTVVADSYESDPEGRWAIAAFREDGVVYVYADSYEPAVLEGNELKMAAYNYRLQLGLGNAGIEGLGGLYPLPDDEAENLPSHLPKDPGNRRVYRRMFKFNPGL